MREKLNENQTAQIALLAVLVVVAGYFILSSFGGGSSSASSSSSGETEVSATVSNGEESVTASTTVEATPAAATSAVSAPAGRKLPQAVENAYEDGETIALLVYRPGGIDDHKVAEASEVLGSMSDVAYFSTPIDKVARYSAITGPVGLNGAPALIVVQPRDLSEGDTATATVDYGFQSAADIKQSVIDARYKGPDLTYAPK